MVVWDGFSAELRGGIGSPDGRQKKKVGRDKLFGLGNRAFWHRDDLPLSPSFRKRQDLRLPTGDRNRTGYFAALMS